MKILARILIVVVVIIAIPLIMALFIKNEYTVEREATINKPKQEVFNYVKHLKNQDNYNYWTMMDPNLKKDFRGTDGTTGFVYAWEGEKAGKGEQEIKTIEEGERLELELRFIKPFESIANTEFTTESVAENQTKVSWKMEGQNPYPFNFMNLFMDNMLGKDLETSLASLKGNLEK
ncbi:MAG TPA: SRPBCC family protein [Cytophagales bacterium]|nr:SRPBCC family protein [Cytophagales bacterium]